MKTSREIAIELAVEAVTPETGHGVIDIDKIERALEAYADERLEEAAKNIRKTCVACGGDGHQDDETECEYCGRPMSAIRSLKSKVEGR